MKDLMLEADSTQTPKDSPGAGQFPSYSPQDAFTPMAQLPHAR